MREVVGVNINIKQKVDATGRGLANGKRNINDKVFSTPSRFEDPTPLLLHNHHTRLIVHKLLLGRVASFMGFCAETSALSCLLESSPMLQSTPLDSTALYSPPLLPSARNSTPVANLAENFGQKSKDRRRMAKRVRRETFVSLNHKVL